MIASLAGPTARHQSSPAPASAPSSASSSASSDEEDDVDWTPCLKPSSFVPPPAVDTPNVDTPAADGAASSLPPASLPSKTTQQYDSDASADYESDSCSHDQQISTNLLVSPEVRNKVGMILGGQVDLPDPPPHPSPVPTNITCPPGTTTYPQLHRKIQSYITSFQYNHTGLPPFFALRRDRGMNHITAISREMIKEGLPIQCVEATFLGIYLTMVALRHLDGVTVVPQVSGVPGAVAIQGVGGGCRK